MNYGKTTIASALCATLAASAAATVPEVSGVLMSQASDRLVTITYTLSDAPAVVTLDVQTNANASAAADDPGWASIGGEAVWNAQGDVWKQVATGNRTITWRPDLSWPDHKIAASGARAVLTAWALDNTPDYMVVHLDIPGAAPNYYPAADYLPKAGYGQAGAAVTDNATYKTTKLLMRKIMAKDITWTMGSTTQETLRGSNEDAHLATLTNNYYIGVFPVTQYQWGLVKADASQKGYFTAEPAMRPIENVTFVEIRNAGTFTSADVSAYDWPAAPHGSSFLGLLRSKTGLDFELPSEAQWEFAARAGNGDGFWGDGSAILNTTADANLSRIARYGGAEASVLPTTPPAEGGTAIVGSYAPNAWGIYDMHGNVYEWCLDRYDRNISALGGILNVNPAAPGSSFGGDTQNRHVLRGGSWTLAAGPCRSAARDVYGSKGALKNLGFRVVCTAGLK